MKAWQPDRFLSGFEALELEFPDDYDGRVLATLVREHVLWALRRHERVDPHLAA